MMTQQGILKFPKIPSLRGFEKKREQSRSKFHPKFRHC